MRAPDSQLQIVGIIILDVLTDPQHDAAEHDQPIRHDVRDTHVNGCQGVVLEQILEHHDGDAASKAAGHERKSQEQHGAGLPGDAVAAVGEAIGRQPRLFDAVDHQHAERRADEGDPVHEVDVHVRPIERRFREHAGVDEEEEAQ